MLKRLHLRVFKAPVDSSFQSAFMDYYNKRAEFSPEFMALEGWKELAKEKVRLRAMLYVVCLLTQYIRIVKQIPSRYGRVLIPIKNKAVTALSN